MLSKEEVEAIIAEADRLKTKKSGSSDNSLETKVGDIYLLVTLDSVILICVTFFFV